MAYGSSSESQVDEEESPKAPGDGMPDEDVQRIVSSALSDAKQYIEEELSPERAEATRYYQGEKFGDEEEGRSQVVSTDVRDHVDGVIPDFIEVLFSDPDSPVEFVPRREDKANEARQQTEWIRYVIQEQDGVMKAHAVIKDGLVRAFGAFKWWWEDGETRVEQLSGLTMEQLIELEKDPDVELGEIKQRLPKRRVVTRAKQMLGLAEMDSPLYDAEVTRHDAEGRVCFEEVPPEEIIFSRQSRGLKRSLCVAHRTEKTKGDLLEMGYTDEEIDEAGGSSLFMSEEEEARRDDNAGQDPEVDDTHRKTVYCEAYMRLDVDGDGRAELRKFCTLGDHFTVVHQEPVDEIPIAVYIPFPEPHTMTGQGVADKTKDIQHIKSHLFRAIFDSAGNAVFPRPLVEEGMASMADVLNNEIGAPIRIRKQGAVQAFENRFIGGDLLPLIPMMDDTAERRTGRNKAVASLDADALQSTTKSAADAVVQGGQAQSEFMIRMFCEQAWKPLFRGLRHLYVKHKPRKKVVRLCGQWTEIDPRTWDTDCDVFVRTALGRRNTEQRAQALGVILQKQEQVLATLGVSQPMVSPSQYANTLRRLAQALGEAEISAYFSEVPKDWKPPEQPQQQDPTTIIAMAQLEIEKMKTERELAIAEAELALKQKQFDQEMLVEVATKAAEIALERERLNAEHQADLTNAELQKSQQVVEGYLAAEELDLREKEIGVNAALAADKQEKDAAVAEKKAAQPKPKKSE